TVGDSLASTVASAALPWETGVVFGDLATDLLGLCDGEEAESGEGDFAEHCELRTCLLLLVFSVTISSRFYRLWWRIKPGSPGKQNKKDTSPSTTISKYKCLRAVKSALTYFDRQPKEA